MGTFGGYTGNMNIPEGKKKKFVSQIEKILNYGGMVQFEKVSMFGYDIGLLKPIEIYPGKNILFHYNYFEDDAWETASFDADSAYFYSEKIGGGEFCDVVTAVHLLYELYDEQPGFAEINADIINGPHYAGWLNHILDERFSMKKRFNLWKNFESYALEQLEHYSAPTPEVLMRMIPKGKRYAACGVEFADLMYIMEGTEQRGREAQILHLLKSLIIRCSFRQELLSI